MINRYRLNLLTIVSEKKKNIDKNKDFGPKLLIFIIRDE